MTWVERAVAHIKAPIPRKEFDDWNEIRAKASVSFLSGDSDASSFIDEIPTTPNMLCLPYPGPLYGLTVKSLDTVRDSKLNQASREIIMGKAYHEREHFHEARRVGSYIETRIAFVESRKGTPDIYFYIVSEVSDEGGDDETRRKIIGIHTAPSVPSPDDLEQLPEIMR